MSEVSNGTSTPYDKLKHPTNSLEAAKHLLPELLRLSDNVWLQVFTHRSFYARPTSVFEDSPNDLSPDNEILEHLGDSVVSLITTELIQETWPGLRVGPATKIRSRVVGNATLAAISLYYDLPRWLRLHPSQSRALRDSQKVQADLFEAYIGGLYLDQGFGLAKWWLAGVMKPLISTAYEEVREEHGLTRQIEQDGLKLKPEQKPGFTIPEPPSLQTSKVGHLSLLNQHCQQKDRNIEWKYCDVPGGTKATPVWTVDAFIDGDYVGNGQGHTKKAARNEAAKQALKFLGIVLP